MRTINRRASQVGWATIKPLPNLRNYLRELIEQGLEDMEDYYLASEGPERVRKGQEPVHSAADVRKDLGLDD